VRQIWMLAGCRHASWQPGELNWTSGEGK
jgi:hypothetical protein